MAPIPELALETGDERAERLASARRNKLATFAVAAQILAQPPRICPNCGGEAPHFVPPSFGESGFFICDTKAPKEKE